MEYGMETSIVTQQEMVQNPAIHRKTHAYLCFLAGHTRPNTGTFSGEGYKSKE
jgi:hypothetical protein